MSEITSQIVPTGAVRRVEGEGRQSTFLARSGSESPILITHREQVTFEIDTPTGSTEVVYGGSGHRGFSEDRLNLKFRAEKIGANSLRGESFHSVDAMIKRIEDEHQTKKVRTDARKEMAKNPIPCVAILLDPSRLHIEDALRSSYVDAVVRGIDMRNNKALVTFFNGGKGSISPSMVLRELDRDERRDIEVADDRLKAARIRLDAATPMRADAALEAIGFAADLTVHYDPVTDLRWTEAAGRRFEGDRDSALIEAIILHVLRDSGQFSHVETYSDDSPRSIHTETAISSHAKVYRAEAECIEHAAAKDAFAAAKDERTAILADFAFDLSLFAGAGKVEVEESKEDLKAQMTIDRIRDSKAPVASPDWED